MKKWLIGSALASALLSGCATVDRTAIPVVEQSGSLLEAQKDSVAAVSPQANVRSAPAVDSGVVVMVPSGAGAAPIQVSPGAVISGTAQALPSGEVPSGIPSGGFASGSVLAADEQLDGPVLALLTTAREQQGGGDLNSAAASLERAQRIAPREPQVLYRLAEVRLAQGDAAQAEQLARRALTYANGRPDLQVGLWNLIAQARERQGDAAGAAQARVRARVAR